MMIDPHLNSSKNDLFLSFIFILCLYFSLNFLYTVCFENIDDILISMRIHGYGIAKYPTDFLSASNTFISHISRLFPTVLGIPGYIIFTAVLLFTSCWMIFYCLLRMNVPLIISIFTSILICLRPILLPQFTVTAGLLALNGILFLCLYRKYNDCLFLLFAGLFACLSFLLRSQQFFFVLLLSLPLFLSKKIWFDGRFRAFILFTIIVCSVLGAMNYRVKNSPDIKKFSEFHYSMIPIFDYGYTHRLISRQDILEKYGYSVNDVQLLGSFFYVTDKYTDTKTITKMINELGPISERVVIEEGLAALRAFSDPSVLPLVSLGLILFILLPLSGRQRLTIIACYLLISVAFFFIGSIGRPGKLRIYFPVAVMILLLPLMLAYFDKLKSFKRLLVISILSFICCIFTVIHMHGIATRNALWSREVQQDIKILPVNEPIFSWGGNFPYNAAYPVFEKWQKFPKIDIRQFGGYTSAPFDKATSVPGSGFLDLMRKQNGVLVVDAGDRCEKFLKPFALEWQLNCQVQCEHQGIIRPNRNITRVRCE